MKMDCQKCVCDVTYCTCPDIDDRLRELRPIISMIWCVGCDKYWSRCTCKKEVILN